MALSSHKLASLLAARLGPVVPAPMAVRSEGSYVFIHIDGGSVGGSGGCALVDWDDDSTLDEDAVSDDDPSLEEAFPDDGRTFESDAVSAVWSVLSGVQDDISEHLTEPWPEDTGRQMALPRAYVANGRVFLSYGGSESAPLVDFAPIEIRDIEAD